MKCFPSRYTLNTLISSSFTTARLDQDDDGRMGRVLQLASDSTYRGRASINFLPLSSPYYALPLSNKSPPAARTNEPLNEHEILSNRFVYFHFQFWRFLQLTKFKIEFCIFLNSLKFDTNSKCLSIFIIAHFL